MMDYLIHLPVFRIVVCQECKYGVLPSHIDTHCMLALWRYVSLSL